MAHGFERLIEMMWGRLRAEGKCLGVRGCVSVSTPLKVGIELSTPRFRAKAWDSPFSVPAPHRTFFDCALVVDDIASSNAYEFTRSSPAEKPPYLSVQRPSQVNPQQPWRTRREKSSICKLSQTAIPRSQGIPQNPQNKGI